ncbi:unnamed protein product [Didymodactylos carnosus]|uniref:PAS domain-containing protein n=1 Tax=Didymodactylos carnosus TaxID=1234261 RepID=A0A8S2CWB3_9BILA|nr:unnamed protein product [Didymodactylos carnosus]CAF3520213.1 unnamed protein product [Didymodactylos carnosus]
MKTGSDFRFKLKNYHYQPEPSTIYQEIYYHDPTFSEGVAILETLQGFILIISCDGELFYASKTVEQYLGFHQSDIIHQSAFELIHSEDREEFKRHLQWNGKLTSEQSNMTITQLFSNPENAHLLERSFTVRFRCLLDNTSGFVTLEIDGRIGILHGQKTQQTDDSHTLALFGVACPFGPPSLFEIPQRESLFKSKHRLTLEPISLDPRGKLILNYTDHDLSQFSGYQLIHPDDLKYYSTAHKELLKTGTSGLVCYRIQTNDGRWQWLQSSMRIIYKSNKPDCVIANHRPLTNEEGQELYYKRGSEFKLPYPCLYDFDTTFNLNGGGMNPSTGAENDFVVFKSSNKVQNPTRNRKCKPQLLKQPTFSPNGFDHPIVNPYTPYMNGYNGCYPYSDSHGFIETTTDNSSIRYPTANDLLHLDVAEKSIYNNYYLNGYTSMSPYTAAAAYNNILLNPTKYNNYYHYNTNNYTTPPQTRTHSYVDSTSSSPPTASSSYTDRLSHLNPLADTNTLTNIDYMTPSDSMGLYNSLYYRPSSSNDYYKRSSPPTYNNNSTTGGNISNGGLKTKHAQQHMNNGQNRTITNNNYNTNSDNIIITGAALPPHSVIKHCSQLLLEQPRVEDEFLNNYDTIWL